MGDVFHYNLHVFDGKKYNQNGESGVRTNPVKDYQIFNPEKLYIDQWIKSAKDAGFKFVILTATHKTGFALFLSDVNPYSVKSLKWRNGQGDIVSDFVNSCRKYGIKPGIYLGIRWNSFLGVYNFKVSGEGEFQKNRQAHYNKMVETEAATTKAPFVFKRLTKEEIIRLQKLKLSGSLEMTRDAFILMCYLGIRYSDYCKINKNNISDDEFLDITMKKTNEQVSIPIHPNALEIIKKWEYQLPQLSNVKLNKQIKEVCRYAEIDELVIDGDKTYSKYELVTCHTARRSFATNGYLSDVPIRDLMRITGHKKETTFLNYVQVKRDVKLSRILEIYPTELQKVV